MGPLTSDVLVLHVKDHYRVAKHGKKQRFKDVRFVMLGEQMELPKERGLPVTRTQASDSVLDVLLGNPVPAVCRVEWGTSFGTNGEAELHMKAVKYLGAFNVDEAAYV